MRSFLTFMLTASPLISIAALDVSAIRGTEMLTFETPRGRQEICVIPYHSELASFSEDDLEKEKELCSYDFHGLTRNREVQQMALCPKINSTNPGVLVVDLPENQSRAKFEAEKCIESKSRSSKDEPKLKTRAKFKQTVTCSYTPSILGYYQLSRILDGAARVPVAVLRTMTKERHRPIAERGYDATRRIGGAIHKGWDILVDADGNGTNANLYDTSREFLYGALQENIKNEEIYRDLVGAGPYDDRTQNFLKKPVYQLLATNQDVFQILGSHQFASVAQSMELMKDASDMILMDTIMTQQDRMGNQHYKWAWKWIEKGEVKTKFVKAKMDDDGALHFKTEEEKEEQAKYASKNAVLVKEMILKDNDCGVRANFYSNKMKNVKALEGIHHMSGRTYTAFMRFARSLRNLSVVETLQNETLMSDLDVKQMLNNVRYSESVLKQKCLSGNLKLDLDLDSHFSSQPTEFKCEI